MKMLVLTLLPVLFISGNLAAPAPPWDFDDQLEAYFAAATAQIAADTREALASVDDWEAFLDVSRDQLLDMLGLSPFPEKTPLQATVTGTVEHPAFTVEKLHFQSLPGMYVTANLYLPKNLKGPAPAILYVCGHATVIKDGYNYGAKVHYQHHPAWFARHGYVCLILDTVQLGEVEGIHHGLHRYDRWWWLCRGYTPAGIEAWNGIRAIDYLLSRPEVAPDQIGITGRSGGGAYSWWVAALDERIQVTVPVAGITDMEDHVINGCVEGHCDCMYMFNTYGWDYPRVAAMVAPRPLLLSNTDRDPIFPIGGVFRTYQQVRPVYEHLDAGDRFALHVTAGPHQDVQELRIHAFRWFDKYLHGREDLIEKPAVKFFAPEQLRVFETLPADAVNDRIDEIFTPTAPPLEETLRATSWPEAKAHWTENLETVFAAWPDETQIAAPAVVESFSRSGMNMTTYAVQTDAHTTLPLFRIQADSAAGDGSTRVIMLDNDNWPAWSSKLAASFSSGHFWTTNTHDPAIEPGWADALGTSGDLYLVSRRGSGPAQFSGDDFKQTQIRKRYYLLGQSLHTMQTWDARQALEAIASLSASTDTSVALHIRADGATAGQALYASLYLDGGHVLRLGDLPLSHREGPYYLRIMRYMDMPAAVMMAGEKHRVHLKLSEAEDRAGWQAVQQVAEKALLRSSIILEN